MSRSVQQGSESRGEGSRGPAAGRLAQLYVAIALVVWVGTEVAIAVMTARDPTANTTFNVYRTAVHAWTAGTEIYGPGIHGFLYFPTFLPVVAPFVWLGEPLGDVVWRCAYFLFLTWALWALARAAAPRAALPVLAALLLLGLPAAGMALQDGQATAPMFAAMVLAAVAIGRARWWAAAGWLALAVAIKPLALVLVLLALALHRPLWLRFPAALLPLLLLPLVITAPGDLVPLYRAAFVKMQIAADPRHGPWAELATLLAMAGWPAPGWLLEAVRAAAALVALWLAWEARRRLPPMAAALAMLLLAVAYLLPFNPRSEETTYLMLGFAIALPAAVAWFVERRAAAAAGLAVLALASGMQAFNGPLFHATEYWLKPLVALLFFVLIALRVMTAGRPLAGARTAPA